MGDHPQRREPDEDDEAQTAELLSVLLHRSASTMPEVPAGVVEASIDAAIGREGRRRRYQFAVVALAAACVGSMLTLATVVGGWIGDGRQEVIAPTATPTTSNYAVGADQHGQTLASLLPASARLKESTTLEISSGITPPWVTDLIARFDVLDEGLESSTSNTSIGTVSYRLAGERVDVAVLVQHLNLPAAGLGSAEEALRTSGLAGVVSSTHSGALLVQRPGDMGPQSGDSGTRAGSAAATLVADDGRVVRLLTRDSDVIPTDVLAALALDGAWLS